MDSSPDLSLKLRRGSNDSRDSYYMDFAQGIDSDIEEVTTIAAAVPSTAISQGVDSPIIQSPIEFDSEDKEEVELSQNEPIPDITLESVEIIAPVTTIPLISTNLTISSDNNNSTTDDDEEISQVTPMPILPPIPIQTLQNQTKMPLVDDDDVK